MRKSGMKFSYRFFPAVCAFKKREGRYPNSPVTSSSVSAGCRASVMP